MVLRLVPLLVEVVDCLEPPPDHLAQHNLLLQHLVHQAKLHPLLVLVLVEERSVELHALLESFWSFGRRRIWCRWIWRICCSIDWIWDDYFLSSKFLLRLLLLQLFVQPVVDFSVLQEHGFNLFGVSATNVTAPPTGPTTDFGISSTTSAPPLQVDFPLEPHQLPLNNLQRLRLICLALEVVVLLLLLCLAPLQVLRLHLLVYWEPNSYNRSSLFF